MNFKKVNWGISILILVTLITFILTKKKDFTDNSFKYGKDFNETRDSLGVPKIESDWVTHESSPTHWYWGKRDKRVTTTKPMHLSKETYLANNEILTEEDDFHYETDDSLAFRIIFKFNFKTSEWTNKIIRYRKGKYPPARSWTLTLDQADSAINEWGMRR